MDLSSTVKAVAISADLRLHETKGGAAPPTGTEDTI